MLAVARVLLVTLPILGIAFGAGHAQTARPTISVAETIPAKPATQAPMAIRIGPPEAVPKGSFIRIRGLPPTVALSDGYSIAPGSWAVPIAALARLKITVPAAVSGRSEITMILVRIDGSVLAEARSTLVVAGSAPSPSASILRAVTPPEAAPDRAERLPASVPPDAQAKMSPAQRARALRFMKHGDELMSQGGVAQARLLYERAAEVGLAQGAMALAATYDAVELARLGVRGLQADRATATRWYERARELGAAEAEQRLRRLGAN